MNESPVTCIECRRDLSRETHDELCEVPTIAILHKMADLTERTKMPSV